MWAATVIQIGECIYENDKCSEAVTINRGFKHFSIWCNHFPKNAKILYLCTGVITHTMIVQLG